MKIVFLVRRFYPYIGGVEKHVERLSLELLKQGHEITILTENKGWSTNEKYKGINIVRINIGEDNWFKKFRIWIAIWKVKSIFKNSDIIHCHDVFFWYLPYKLLYANKPVYITFHGYESYPIKFKAIIIRKISEKLSDGNICIGKFITKWYKTKANIISYGAVDIPKIIGSVKNKYSAVFVGRLDEQTGFDVYLEAFKLLKKKYPELSLTVVGDGPLKKLVDGSVNLLGFQADSEKYIADASLVFASRYLAILEALAAKKTVFAVYDNPVKKDYLQMTPFAKYINISGNLEELIKGIEVKLHESKLDITDRKESFQWVSQQSWEQLANSYKRLWKIEI